MCVVQSLCGVLTVRRWNRTEQSRTVDVDVADEKKCCSIVAADADVCAVCCIQHGIRIYRVDQRGTQCRRGLGSIDW